MNPSVRTGLERALREGPPRDAKAIGLLTHEAARDRSGLAGRRALLEAGFPLIRLFSPEHGLGADAPDGAAVNDRVDGLTRLPVTSLYGNRLGPDQPDLAGIDLMMVDLQDIGARHYTYIWTLFLVMEACEQAGVPIRVLDRPNPTGGEMAAAEGPLPDPCARDGFFGLFPLPVRHCLTMGELARLWQKSRFPHLNLIITAMEEWRRPLFWPETGLTFQPPSPAIREWEATLFYPGTCLLEGTNVSVGRGTDAPFLQIGAPWMKAEPVMEHLRCRAGPAVSMRAVEFTPVEMPWQDRLCRGIRFQSKAPAAVRPVALGLHLLAALWEVHRQDVAWLRYPTAAHPSGEDHFSRLIGRKEPARRLETGVSLAEINNWTACPGWHEQTAASLLYPN